MGNLNSMEVKGLSFLEILAIPYFGKLYQVRYLNLILTYSRQRYPYCYLPSIHSPASPFTCLGSHLVQQVNIYTGNHLLGHPRRIGHIQYLSTPCYYIGLEGRIGVPRGQTIQQACNFALSGQKQVHFRLYTDL